MQIIRSNSIITEAQSVSEAVTGTAVTAGQQLSFQEMLSHKLDEARPLQFSKHASLRLSNRDIQLSQDQLRRVESGVAKARAKGINDSLVLIDNVTLVVNVKNKVVVTALGRESENVFTNIDGAVIV